MAVRTPPAREVRANRALLRLGWAISGLGAGPRAEVRWIPGPLARVVSRSGGWTATSEQVAAELRVEDIDDESAARLMVMAICSRHRGRLDGGDGPTRG
jgi:hypothetical protein